MHIYFCCSIQRISGVRNTNSFYKRNKVIVRYILMYLHIEIGTAGKLNVTFNTSVLDILLIYCLENDR